MLETQIVLQAQKVILFYSFDLYYICCCANLYPLSLINLSYILPVCLFSLLRATINHEVLSILAACQLVLQAMPTYQPSYSHFSLLSTKYHEVFGCVLADNHIYLLVTITYLIKIIYTKFNLPLSFQVHESRKHA